MVIEHEPYPWEFFKQSTGICMEFLLVLLSGFIYGTNAHIDDKYFTVQNSSYLRRVYALINKNTILKKDQRTRHGRQTGFQKQSRTPC